MLYKIDKIQKESKRIQIILKIIVTIINILLIPIIIFNITLIIESVLYRKVWSQQLKNKM